MAIVLGDDLTQNNNFRVEKDNINIKHEIEEIKVLTDEVTRAKVK